MTAFHNVQTHVHRVIKNTKTKHPLLKIAVLFGGISEEANISLQSAQCVHEACLKLGYTSHTIALTKNLFQHPERLHNYDVALNCSHGEWGEDGFLAAWLQKNHIPYLGSASEALKRCFDKQQAKSHCHLLNIPTPKSTYFHADTPPKDANFPCVIKPNEGGSSIDLHLVNTPQEWPKTLSPQRHYLLESYIQGTEISVGVLSGKALPPIEIECSNFFFNYHEKYVSNTTTYKPCTLSVALQQQVCQYTETLFKILNCKHWGRADFRYDGNAFYFLEMNLVPGMTTHSLLPKIAQLLDISYENLVQYLVGVALNVTEDETHNPHSWND